MKWRYLEKQWQERSDWIDNAKVSFTKLSYRYKDNGSSTYQAAARLPRAAASRFDDVISDDEGEATAPSIDKQLSDYLAEPRSKSIFQEHSPIPYWIGNRSRWPQLAAMALDVYSTPVMSDEPERVFSVTGALIGTRRRTMSSDSIRFNMCLKAWLDRGMVNFDRYSGTPPLGGGGELTTAIGTYLNLRRAAPHLPLTPPTASNVYRRRYQ
jgi:hypothetical protein